MENEKITQRLRIHSFFKSISNLFISLFVPLIVYNQMGYQMAILYLIMLGVFTGITPVIFSRLIKREPVISICLHIIKRHMPALFR